MEITTMRNLRNEFYDVKSSDEDVFIADGNFGLYGTTKSFDFDFDVAK